MSIKHFGAFSNGDLFKNKIIDKALKWVWDFSKKKKQSCNL